MLVTALSPSIGYEKASKIAQLAHEKNLSLRQASSQLNYLDQEGFLPKMERDKRVHVWVYN